MNSVDFFSTPSPQREAECFLTLVRLNILLICQLSHYHGPTFFKHFSSKLVSPSLFVQLLLPPANQVWGKVVFHRCLSVHKGGICLWVQECASGSGVHTPWTPPPRNTHTHWTHTSPGTPPGHAPSPRSTSGRYASYWNAFLLLL